MLKRLNHVIDAIHDSYLQLGVINHLDGPKLPSRESVVKILRDIESLIFPGYREDETIVRENIRYVVAERVSRVAKNLTEETHRSLCFQRRHELKPPCGDRDREALTSACYKRAEEIALSFVECIPEIRRRIKLDVEAAFQGDPASKSREEVILAYPGVEAVIAHRVAHELWIRDVPLIPRMMSEHIHGETGIDIHPGAVIGDSFFIDHATGVVIGETTIIGKNVKIYQGVTIGALSVKKEEADKKRHPTIEDDVTIYAGATILGGKTVIGEGSIIGGNVWITESVPPGSKIYNKPSSYVRKAPAAV
ncbi:MAG: serine acetyltransferase [Spirochaetaceae bacterium]|nr:MAG: serine acetyltransferase [Spirochaetaceae bacterium]